MLQQAHERLLGNIKEKVLKDNMYFLSKSLEPRRHYAYLRSKAILSCEDQEQIESIKTRSDRVVKLVEILLTKGPKAFDELCNTIELERTQIFLLEQLHKDLEAEIVRCCPRGPERQVHFDSTLMLPLPGPGNGLPLPTKFDFTDTDTDETNGESLPYKQYDERSDCCSEGQCSWVDDKQHSASSC